MMKAKHIFLLLILSFFLFNCQDDTPKYVPNYDVARDEAYGPVIYRMVNNANEIAAQDLASARDSLLAARKLGLEKGYPYFAGTMMITLAEFYHLTSQNDSAIYYLKIANEHPYTAQDIDLKTEINHALITNYAHSEQLDSARFYLTKQLLAVDTSELTKYSTLYFQDEAKVAQMAGDKPRQVEYLTKVVDYYRTGFTNGSDSTEIRASIENFVESALELVITIFNNNSEDKAVPLLLEAMEHVNASPYAFPFIDNIAGQVLSKKHPEEAIFYFRRAIQFSPEDTYNTANGTGYLGIAQVYMNEDNFDLAARHLDTLQSLGSLNGDIRHGIFSLRSRLALKTGDAVSARIYIDSLSNYLTDAQDSMEYELNLIASKIIGLAPGSANLVASLRSTQDSLTKNTTNYRIEELETKYRTEVKDRIIAEKTTAVELEQAKRRQATTIGLVAGGSAFLLTLLAWMLYGRNKQLIIAKQSISHLNQDLNHRTSNYLGSIRFLLERQRDSADEAGLDVTVVNSLDRQILAFTKVQDKLKETLDDVNLKEYLEDFCEAVREALAAQGRPVQFNVNVADVDVKPSFAAPLALIINELATNSMKYARREDGLLRIALDAVEVNGGELRVFYRDGGAQDGEIDQGVFSSGQGVETILGFTDQLKGRVVRYGEESYDYEAVFGLEG